MDIYNHRVDRLLYMWPDKWSGDLHAYISIKKSVVIHDTECPYWDQMSLNKTKFKPYIIVNSCNKLTQMLSLSPLLYSTHTMFHYQGCTWHCKARHTVVLYLAWIQMGERLSIVWYTWYYGIACITRLLLHTGKDRIRAEGWAERDTMEESLSLALHTHNNTGTLLFPHWTLVTM